MKINKFIYVLIAGAVVSTSCKKSFLDQKPPAAVNIGDAIKTESDMSDAVNGMFNASRSSSLFGRDIPVLGDVLADNAYISSSNSGRYLQENNYTYIVTNAEANNIWSQGYYTILQANRIINTALPTSTAVGLYKGEAYTTRALVYLQLANFYSTPYTVNPGADGVPLVTGYQGAYTKPSRSKLADVYAKIISDLDSAYAIMPPTATSSEYMNKYAAKALQARAYLYKGDYANARDAALEVVNKGGYTLLTAAGFAAYWTNPGPVTNKQETIFELALTNITNNGTAGLDYIYNPAGYGDILSTDPLYNLYSATDVRKSLIINGKRSGAQAYIVNKYSNVSNPNDRDDLKILRYSEVLLTLAESYARLGDMVNALKYLNQLVAQRDPSLVYASTGDQLISDILTERRKELAFEGLRFFDLKRTNVTINRPVEANSAPSITTIATDNFRRLLPIPQAETDVNKSITQNPNY
ncbi:RagB/SusD family nutrient uptake outer membrane protein [Mucilaginibacter lappiensis]|uniref:Uncharacterized protein n=1 Tax=Mucilaginibacter lappiensis TaxID=354630 RepID=A0A1N6Q7A9_9SPHI|nr:RagB/SusD family nutrient uptake outer membrane protein [Mucilaginibacter lappiensis]MBB6107318.1 hypothetical protein [Mucilaginibacter lappiensis]MBB6126407.1 hypothetical protein [Mucilaginibacter lappiensis]SIQ12488.1 Starch-binding associating with outer membrane [Mucilaginibacter lappiensis]